MPYDFLINATGPALRFDKTEGLGPDGGNSLSVCLPGHAAQAAAALAEEVERMRRGERRRFLVGVGHGTCTCEGAAFEYIVNLEFELRNRGVRDKAEITWITNEYELGDFGMGGMHLKRGGYVTPSSIFNASLFAERGIDWITRAHVSKVEPDRVLYETLDGNEGEQAFDFAMLLPPFSGVGLKAFDREGGDITERLFMPNEFMRVDADYTPKPYEDWKASDWPRTYQSPDYRNIFAAGIAFAPPHAISRPSQEPERHGDRARAAAHRHAVGDDRQGRREQHRRHDPRRRRADPHRLDGRDGRRLRRLRRREPLHRHRRLDDRLPDRPRLRALPRVRPRQRSHVRRDRPRRPLDQDPAPPPVPLQGAPPPRLAPDPGVDTWKTEHASYVTKPTRFTVFMRTFLPWQLWRFAAINLKMVGIIRRSHHGDSPK